MPRLGVARESPAELSVMSHSLPVWMPWTYCLSCKKHKVEAWPNMELRHIPFTKLGIIKMCIIPNISPVNTLFLETSNHGGLQNAGSYKVEETLALGGFVEARSFSFYGGDQN